MARSVRAAGAKSRLFERKRHFMKTESDAVTAIIKIVRGVLLKVYLFPTKDKALEFSRSRFEPLEKSVKNG